MSVAGTPVAGPMTQEEMNALHGIQDPKDKLEQIRLLSPEQREYYFEEYPANAAILTAANNADKAFRQGLLANRTRRNAQTLRNSATKFVWQSIRPGVWQIPGKPETLVKEPVGLRFPWDSLPSASRQYEIRKEFTG